MKKILLLSTLSTAILTAGGYKLPEQSLNSMAKSGANVAYTIGADANYDNPANMSFMDGGKSFVEGGVTLVYLPPNVYTAGPASGESKAENIPIPYFHYVSKAMGDFRWGVSLAVPGGLTKRWETPYQKTYAEEFTLKVIELNPTLSYKVSENFSVAAGVRLIYSEGIVRSDSALAHTLDPANVPARIARHMEGDTVAFGYNLAMSYRPTKDIALAATYRSNVDLKEEGEANLWLGNIGKQYNASVTVPLPATLVLAASKTWNNTFTLEFVYERAYWSKYKVLDFQYESPILPALAPFFDKPIQKNWKDTNTFRLGATMIFDKITVMMGLAIDESPVPPETLGFETPDTDAKIFSMGFQYQQTANLSWGLALLYDSKDPISFAPGDNVVNPVIAQGGSFTGGGAYLTTIGLTYEY